jgi:hypothetical protein
MIRIHRNVLFAASLGVALIACGTAAEPLYEQATPPLSGASEASISRAIELANTVTSEDDPRYHSAIVGLRASSATAVEGIVAKLGRTGGEARIERWSTVSLLAALRVPEAVAPLARIAREPLPPVVDAASSALRRGEVETRYRALSGLADLEATGSSAAKRELFALFRSDEPSMRRAAAVAFLSHHSGDDARSDVRRALPEADRALADLRPMTDADVGPPMTAPVGRTKPRRGSPSPRVLR